MSKPAAAEGAEAHRKKIRESVNIPGGEPISGTISECVKYCEQNWQDDAHREIYQGSTIEIPIRSQKMSKTSRT